MDPLIAAQSKTAPPAAARQGIKHTDVFGYIYTSGTTGLPKAANIPHSKMFGFGVRCCCRRGRVAPRH